MKTKLQEVWNSITLFF